MKLVCPDCGNDSEFYAGQYVRGTITVLVAGDGEFLNNCGENGTLDASGLDFDTPEGPKDLSETTPGNPRRYRELELTTLRLMRHYFPGKTPAEADLIIWSNGAGIQLN